MYHIIQKISGDIYNSGETLCKYELTDVSFKPAVLWWISILTTVAVIF